jgi:hypothetical protein
MLLTTLIVVVLGSHAPRPSSMITVERRGQQVAQSRSGRLTAHVSPGRYRIEVRLTEGHVSHPRAPRKCYGAIVRVRGRTARFNISCP